MVRVSHKIKHLLVDEGLVSNDEWEQAVGDGANVLDSLLSRGTIDESTLMEVLGRSSGMAPVDLGEVTPDPAALEAIPEETCKEHGILPISKNADVLTIAVSDPFNVILFDDLKRLGRALLRVIHDWSGLALGGVEV